VNFKIAKDFTNSKGKSFRARCTTTLQPGQLLVKLVKDELTELMGGDVAGINLSKSYSYLDVSLQGSGKTTFPENWPIIF
jgi:signal recognition particle subunit SRP54